MGVFTKVGVVRAKFFPGSLYSPIASPKLDDPPPLSMVIGGTCITSLTLNSMRLKRKTVGALIMLSCRTGNCKKLSGHTRLEGGGGGCRKEWPHKTRGVGLSEGTATQD